MPQNVALPRQLDNSAFSAADAAAHGVGRGRLRNLDIEHPFHGVHSRGVDLESVIGLCRSYLLVMRDDQYFSQVTAAQLFGIPLPGSVTASPLHVATLARVSTSEDHPPGDRSSPRSRGRGRGVVGHAITDCLTTTSAQLGLPVIGIADVWLQLATVLSREDLVAAGDFIVSGERRLGGYRTDPLATRAELREVVTRSAGRRGVMDAKWALSRIRIDVDSRPESLLRLILVEEGFPEPGINVPTAVDAGMLILHADLTWPEWRIVLEYEGDEHRTSTHRFRSDIARREKFETAGWRVIRVTADDLGRNRAAFIVRVRRIIRERTL